MVQDSLQRYCDRYAEPIAAKFYTQKAALLPRTDYHSVVCIPAYDEPPEFLAPLLNGMQAQALVILVLNAPIPGGSPSEIVRSEIVRSRQTTTQQTLQSLTSSKEQLSWIPWNRHLDLLVVDCCTEGRQLPLRQGVGLARKIACDLAVTCIAHGKVASPWIYCTDADVQLPSPYFEAVVQAEQSGLLEHKNAALLYPFTHQPIHENILQYELSLRYYVLQLAQAGSPYAFQTIGSAMVAHVDQYVAVRGFPKRDAAEDFYILNKLAKTGTLVNLNTEPLILSSRRSHRVPFGTGAAMNRLRTDPVQRLYHPEIFVHLKDWIEHIERLWAERDRIQSQGLNTWWHSSSISITCDLVLPILIELGLPKVLDQAYRQCGDRAHFLFYLHVWFDGFRTLRFVHLMRDRGFSSWAIPDYQRQFLAVNGDPMGLSMLNQTFAIQEAKLPSLVGPTQLLRTKGIPTP